MVLTKKFSKVSGYKISIETRNILYINNNVTNKSKEARHSGTYL